ncbi:MAG: glutamine synthetase III [Clostridia bacterium]|nr:glutamine synthetase III [Clostridia bacterium]
MANLNSLFGSKVFNDSVMKERLPKETYISLRNTISEGKELDLSVANIVANAMKDWAIDNGATHYTHWFQPMTGITAEKHDSFLTIQSDGTVLTKFSGKNLIKGESDASSFPSGGLRATFEARGYTAWDPTSYAFIKDDTLCIPTVFCSHGGEVLDKKTPLLRSMEALSHQALRIMRLLGDNESIRVTPMVGAEQEYFLIDKEMYEKRSDLIFTGKTLFGAKPPKTQELNDQYYGTISPKVKKYMADIDLELWALGVYAKTEHNEAAPAQHEFAPTYSNANTATDHNQLMMETMKTLALRHGFVCLLGEKPFDGINGSGKHNNWSASTNTGVGLFDPGKEPYENTRFLLFLAAMIKAVDEYQDLLRISVASASNDRRLGGHEAPPAILSIFLGEELTDIIDSIITGKRYGGIKKTKMETGVNTLPEFARDNTDRNRTSPFAFTGNKFEFRMPGASQSIADPNIVLNTIMAESLSQFADKLEKKSEDIEASLRRFIKETFKKHRRILFNGNGYAPEWVAEAEARGLCNYRTTADAVPHLTDEKNVSLFAKHHVYTEAELISRREIMFSDYVKITHIEASTMLDMAKKEIIPASLSYMKEISETVVNFQSIGIDSTFKKSLLAKISENTDSLAKELDNLSESLEKLDSIKEVSEQANFARDSVIPTMNKVRLYADNLETLVAKKYWPFPTYGEMLFV